MLHMNLLLPTVKSFLTFATPVPFNRKRASVLHLLSFTSMPLDANGFPFFPKLVHTLALAPAEKALSLLAQHHKKNKDRKLGAFSFVKFSIDEEIRWYIWSKVVCVQILC